MAIRDIGIHDLEALNYEIERNYQGYKGKTFYYCANCGALLGHPDKKCATCSARKPVTITIGIIGE